MYCIYHSRDLDGYCSGAIIKKKYPDINLIGYDYGDPIPYDKMKNNTPIIMVDVSLPMNEMLAMGVYSGSQFTWIDHHKSAIDDFYKYKKENNYNPNFIKAVLKEGIAACEITWEYLFSDKEMPVTVELLGQYDTFRNENKTNWNLSVLPFQYGMRIEGITNADSFPQNLLAEDLQIDTITKIINKGSIALNYQTQQDALNMKSSFSINFEGLRTICCNGAGLGSMAFDSVWDEDKFDLMMPFKYNGKNWSFSLYTTKNDIDCSEIAKKFGGGGHAKASGFLTDMFPDFLKN